MFFYGLQNPRATYAYQMWDGCACIDPQILQAGKSGHYGLMGMRERAARIGAKITVVSSTAGTIVTLFVPGEAIFIA